MAKSKAVSWIIGIAVVLAVTIFGAAIFSVSPSKLSSSAKLQVVAGENFWGSLVSQIGGNKVVVDTIVSDPNADPHEYQSTTNDARAFARANYVILNGAGYDSWGDKLLSASPSDNRKVLTVATLLGKKNGDNPHFWYSPSYVQKVVNQIKHDLISLDPKDATYFSQQYATLQHQLASYTNQINNLKEKYSGTKVASTEDIFVYLAQAAGLNLISPPAFMQAVAEGNDPPASSVVQFEQQLSSNQVKLLVYNRQTITPLTSSIKQLAAAKNIPIVGISEIISPPNASFENWMNAQLTSIEAALKH